MWTLESWLRSLAWIQLLRVFLWKVWGAVGCLEMRTFINLLNDWFYKWEFSPCRRPGQLIRYSDCLRAALVGDRIPVEARFCVPVQTGLRVHPDSCTMGTWFFLGVQRPGHGADHPLPSSVDTANGLELGSCVPFLSVRAQACHGVTFTFFTMYLVTKLAK
jgi:hypothetical protein